jgi:hypothetical protein
VNSLQAYEPQLSLEVSVSTWLASPARAYALRGDVAKSRAAYETLFANWKNADPDLPILKQAKAEFAKLQ